MPHHVRRDPGNSLSFHIVGERASKIEPIAVASLYNIGLQHVGRTQAPLFKKICELICQRDRVGVSVLRSEGRRGANFDCACRKIEPFGHGLDDFQLPHPGMKAGEENVTQIVCGSVFDELLSQVKSCVECSPFSIDPVELNIKNWIATAEIFFHAPIEE